MLAARSFVRKVSDWCYLLLTATGPCVEGSCALALQNLGPFLVGLSFPSTGALIQGESHRFILS